MTSYVETKIVALTSQSATIKYNSTFLSNVFYGLGAIFNNDANIVHKQVQLLNAQIPYSFYVINSTNNQFRYRLGAGTIFQSSIPAGNYNGNSLITALKASLSSNSITLTITLSAIDGKLTFTHASSNFTFFSVTNSILPNLGFIAGTNYTSASLTLTTPNALNLLGIKTLQIRSTNLIMGNISSVQGGQTTLLSTIPVDCVPFGMMNYVDKGNHLMTIHNDSLDDLQIEIIDGENGYYIDFNNQDWCITLAFHITRVFETPQKTTFSTFLKGSTTQSGLLEDKDLPEPNLTSDITLAKDESKDDAKPDKAGQIPNKDLEELNTLLGKGGFTGAIYPLGLESPNIN
jgi:hypothetical protein